jgi:hypothetical protein
VSADCIAIWAILAADTDAKRPASNAALPITKGRLSMSVDVNAFDVLLSLMQIEATLGVINFRRPTRIPLPTGRLL